MKKSSVLLAVLIMLAVFTVPALAYERPYGKPDYLCTDGGMDNTGMYFSGMRGNIYKLVDLSFGEGAYQNEESRRINEIWISLGVDPNMTHEVYDEDILTRFYQETNKYHRRERTYDMVQTFGITKAQFIEANGKLAAEDRFTDEEIELVYGGDMNALLKYAKHPLAYVYGDEIYCFNEVLSALDYSKQYEMYIDGDFGEYLAEMKETVTTEFSFSDPNNPYLINDLELEWLNYVSWRLASGEVPENAPPTGDGVPMLIAVAAVSAVVAVTFRRRVRFV